jgi:indolepyruvate ferredoxin oxidoreductase
MAPPVLSRGTDARGRPRKRRFGPWLTPVLSRLAGMKRLRGTALDPFGYSAERREERALIDWFVAVLADLPPLVSGASAKDAEGILAAPLEFRGYGPVKQKAVALHKPRADAMLAGLKRD